MDVLGVHGIAQEQKGRPELEQDWQLGLANGIARAGGREQPVPGIDVAFYGDLYLSEADEGEPQPTAKGALDDVSWVDLPIEPAELDFLDRAVADVEERTTDLGEAMGAPPVPEALRPIAARLTRRFQGGLVLQFVGALRQVKRYLDDDELAGRIRDRVITELAHGPQVVVAHSLGTVVTLDTLTLNPELVAPTLITLGSPLGIRAVTSQLRRPDGTRGPSDAPDALRRWVNIYDPGDPVAAAGGLSRLWPSVADYTVANGNDPHNIRHYLSKKIAGESVLAGLS